MKVYLDNSASTPVLSEVIDAMLPFFADEIGNAQSVHTFGQRARAAVETARRQVASLIGCSPTEIVFVAGGTEADNFAVRGIAEAHSPNGHHIITTTVEHPAVLATCHSLEERGFQITYLPVSTRGLIDTDQLREAITDETILVSIMHANNETGTIQSIEDAAHVIVTKRKARSSPLHFHTDAVQSAGKIPVDVNSLGVDLLSLSAHKIHGPKGIGALYVRKGTRLNKLLHGGHHERDRRAGTENVPAIVGFGFAAELARLELEDRASRMRRLRNQLEAQIMSSVSEVTINGDVERRLPNVSNLSFSRLDGETLLIALDLKGVAVSTGAACASGSVEPSHVLLALGLSREQVRGSLRFSLSSLTTEAEIEYVARTVADTVNRLREIAPEDQPDKSLHLTPDL